MALNAKRVIFAVALKVQIEDIYQLLVLEVFNFFHALKACHFLLDALCFSNLQTQDLAYLLYFFK